MKKKFDEIVEAVLGEKTDLGKYEDVKFSLGPSEISEIAADAGDSAGLTPDEQYELEVDLNALMDRIYKKYKGSLDGVKPFWKEAAKIGNKYNVIIKQ